MQDVPTEWTDTSLPDDPDISADQSHDDLEVCLYLMYLGQKTLKIGMTQRFLGSSDGTTEHNNGSRRSDTQEATFYNLTSNSVHDLKEWDRILWNLKACSFVWWGDPTIDKNIIHSLWAFLDAFNNCGLNLFSLISALSPQFLPGYYIMRTVSWTVVSQCILCIQFVHKNECSSLTYAW